MCKAVGGAKRIQRDASFFRSIWQRVTAVGRKIGFVVAGVVEAAERHAILELLPWTEMATVFWMQNYAKTFVRGYTHQKPREKERYDEEAPPPGLVGENKKNPNDQSPNDLPDSWISNKENASFVSVANRPADKIWMGLTTEGRLDHLLYSREGRRMGSMLDSVENGSTILVR